MTRFSKLYFVATVAALLAGCGNGGGTINLGGIIVLKDVSRVVYDADSWNPPPNGPGSAAIVRQPPAGPVETGTAISKSCVLRDKPQYTSEMGVSPLKLRTSKQDVTATFVDDRYVIDGFVPDSAYDTDDESLEVSYEGAEPFTEMVPVTPALGDPNNYLGARDGLGTEIMMDDGRFQLAEVSVSGGTTMDNFEVLCTYYADSMELRNGKRIAPMVEADARDEMMARGLIATTVIVSFDNEVLSDKVFPGFDPTSLRAGRAMSINAADLTIPMPGACNFPTLVPLDSGGMGKLCFNQGPSLNECTATSDACPNANTWFEFVVNGSAHTVVGGLGLQVTATSHGTLDQPLNRVTNLPEDTDITVTAADFNSNQFDITFRISGGSVTVSNLTVQ